MRESTRMPAAAVARNPFASFASPSGGGRDAGAETKLYEVPRELIEIARARASSDEHAGTTTPLAPRPDAELAGTLRAYTERLSSKPAGIPSPQGVERIVEEAAAADAPIAAARAADPVERRAEPEPRGSLEPEPLLLQRPLSRRSGAPLRPARAVAASRAWIMYAALSLLGLGSCAHVLFGS